MSTLQIWGGIECSCNRVGDAFHSQLAMSGHCDRLADLDLVAGLGIRTLRYPVLWEHVVGALGSEPRWAHADAALARIAALGIVPIAGLVHHGSGPAGTSLLEPSFADGLAEYAAAVAARFPWIEHYTPVNEPLTTARFSCLYGLWYPHLRDDGAFSRALVNQCRGIVLAMRAVRRVNPAARLVQTEDLGRCDSTPELRYQAEFENERRWLTWDLLAGRVDRTHPMWGFLVAGAGERALAWLVDNPCPPDIVGINHYVTSDRFLHHRVELFPPDVHGGNGRDRYADVEAVRVLATPGEGLRGLLREAWQRYGLPLAITEAHLACTREEQVRWLAEVWQTAQDARAEGIDVRAVTPWALFGSFDWNDLLVNVRGHYEPGAFDLRGPEPRPTALARLIADLASGRDAQCAHLLSTPGWWRRPERIVYTHATQPERAAPAHGSRPAREARRPLLVTGARGTLGQAFGRICATRGLHCIVQTRDELDIADSASVEAALARHRPWAVVNAAGYVRVDAAEHDRERCFRENAEGPAVLAAVCARHDLPLVTFSSDLVFDGERSAPYVETDVVRPLSVYGQSKARAEERVLQRHDGALILRTSAFFGPWDAHNFVTTAVQKLRRGERLVVMDSASVSPTYVPDLVHAALDLLLDGEQGLWHLNNVGVVSWLELAREAAARAKVPADGVCAGAQHDGFVARRPLFSAMTSCRGILLPSLEDALGRYFAAMTQACRNRPT